MLSWDEEIKPAPVQNAGATSAAAAPSLSGAPAAQPSLHTPPAAASTEAPAPTRRVNVADKRIINGQTDVNQLVPFKYK